LAPQGFNRQFADNLNPANFFKKKKEPDLCFSELIIIVPSGQNENLGQSLQTFYRLVFRTFGKSSLIGSAKNPGGWLSKNFDMQGVVIF
jgi:hypothetical protein